MSDSRWTAADDANLLFHNLTNFVELLNPNGNNSKAALMLVADWMIRWSVLPLNEHRDDIFQLTWILKRKLTAVVYF